MTARRLLALVVFAAAFAAAQSPQTSELVQIEKRWAASLQRGETAYLESITAPDWTNTGSNGKVRSKAEVLAGIRSGAAQLQSVELSQVQARVYGDTAVVTGIFDERGSAGGKPFREYGRFTDTFIRRNRHWQCVATHTSNIADQ